MLEGAPIGWFDIAVAAVLLLSGAMAFSKGFVRSVLSVAAWIGAAAVAIYAFPIVRPHARDLIPMNLGADLAAGAGLFVVSLIVFSLLTQALSSKVKDSALNALDRSLGFLFGLIRGAVVVCLAYIGIVWLFSPDPAPGWVQNARTQPLIESGADLIRDLIPGSIRASGSDAAERARSGTEQALETKRMMDEILTPRPRDADGADEPGYDQHQRGDMNRLIESTGP